MENKPLIPPHVLKKKIEEIKKRLEIPEIDDTDSDDSIDTDIDSSEDSQSDSSDE